MYGLALWYSVSVENWPKMQTWAFTQQLGQQPSIYIRHSQSRWPPCTLLMPILVTSTRGLFLVQPVIGFVHSAVEGLREAPTAIGLPLGSILVPFGCPQSDRVGQSFGDEIYSRLLS